MCHRTPVEVSGRSNQEVEPFHPGIEGFPRKRSISRERPALCLLELGRQQPDDRDPQDIIGFQINQHLGKIPGASRS
jgi:hypothetical protein